MQVSILDQLKFERTNFNNDLYIIQIDTAYNTARYNYYSVIIPSDVCNLINNTFEEMFGGEALVKSHPNKDDYTMTVTFQSDEAHTFFKLWANNQIEDSYAGQYI